MLAEFKFGDWQLRMQIFYYVIVFCTAEVRMWLDGSAKTKVEVMEEF